MIKVALPGVINGHDHLRTEDLLTKMVLLNRFLSLVVAMGNTDPLVDSHLSVRHYRREIKRQSACFMPAMTIMLTALTTPYMLWRAFDEGTRIAKLIPRDTSHNSANGISLFELELFRPLFLIMQALGIKLSIHAELARTITGEIIHYLDREERAIPFVEWLAQEFPSLIIIVEHVSTGAMLETIKKYSNVFATLSARHASATWEMAFDRHGKFRNPHYFCLPVLKKEGDRLAVEKAMVSGDPRIIYGEDSAPHPIAKKKCAQPSPGSFCPPEIALPLLANIFERQEALHRLKGFVFHHPSRLYGWEVEKPLILEKNGEDWKVPTTISGIVPFMAGRKLHWKIAP